MDLSELPGSLSGLSTLAACVRIKSLHLPNDTFITDLSPLSSLVELTSLRLGSKLLQHIDALAKCTQLAELRLFIYSNNPHLMPLASCQHLRSLLLSSDLNGDDLLPLVKCPLLSELALRCCGRLSDIGALPKLPRLHYLTLWGCRALTDISPLSNCMMLPRLFIGRCGISEDSISAMKAAKPGLFVTK